MAIGLRAGAVFALLAGVAIAACSAGSSAPKSRVTTSGGAGGGTGNSGGNSGMPGFAGGLTLDTSACGDHKFDPGEACDDGNTAAGDGCSAACQIEADCTCDDSKTSCACMVVCGDGVL